MKETEYFCRHCKTDWEDATIPYCEYCGCGDRIFDERKKRDRRIHKAMKNNDPQSICDAIEIKRLK